MSSFRRNYEVKQVKFHPQINALSQRKHHERTKPNIDQGNYKIAQIRRWLTKVQFKTWLCRAEKWKTRLRYDIKVKITIWGGHKERTPLKISNMAGTVVTSVTAISLKPFQRISDQIFTIRLHEYRRTLDIYECGEWTAKKQRRNCTKQLHILHYFNIQTLKRP